MPFIGAIEIPQMGDNIRVTIPTEPGFILDVVVVARWTIDQLGVPQCINFAFLLPRDAFPLVFARRVVVLDTIKQEWTVHIKDGEETIFQEVIVKIIHDPSNMQIVHD